MDIVATGKSRRGRPALVFAALLTGLACGWAASGVIYVQPDEQALITRLDGRAVTAERGLHYHWPGPLGAAVVTPAGATTRTGGRAMMRIAGGDGIAATFEVDWRPADPARLANGFSDPGVLVRTAAAEAVTRTYTNTPLAVLAAPGQDDLPARALSALQESLDRLHTGIRAEALTLRSLDPPSSARNVVEALQAEARTAAAAAQVDAAERTSVLAAARADAAREVAAAEGARDQEVSEAKGEAARFARIDAVARKAPAITRERLYTETMERILHDTRKIVVQLAPGAQIALPADALTTLPKSGAPPAGRAQGAPVP